MKVKKERKSCPYWDEERKRCNLFKEEQDEMKRVVKDLKGKCK
jgi:hypothetical protein